MRLVLRDRLLRIDGVVNVDQQKMVAGVLIVVAGMRHTHVAQAKPDQECTAYSLPVIRGYKIDLRVLWSRLALREGHAREQCERRRQRQAAKDLHQSTPAVRD